MSLTSKQIDELRAYAADRKGELAKLITDAADTIEMLSAKLHASQMERSSQYYHGGWIPCSERLPEGEQFVLVTYKTTDRIHVCQYHEDGSRNQWYSLNDMCRAHNNVVVAWMPLPEPYRKEGD